MKVLIIEDLTDTQQWLKNIVLEAFNEASVTFASTVKKAQQHLSQDWNLLLVDLGLPDGSGIQLIREATQLLPNTPVIVTTIYDDDDNLFNALASGADGYLLKSQPRSLLVQQIKQHRSGIPAMTSSIARRLLNHFQQQSQMEETKLSRRELDVLTCIGQGLRTQEAAQALALSEHTVTTYIRNLYEKLNISTRAQAALEAAKRGLIDQ